MKIQNKLLRVFSKVKVQKQLFFIYFAAILIPILIICLFLFINTRHLIYNHYKSAVESDNIRVKSIMFDASTNFYKIAEDLSSDKQLFKLLQTEYTGINEFRNDYNKYTRITNLLANDTSVNALNIYTTNDTISDYNIIKYATPEIQKADWFQAAVKKPGAFWKTTKRTDKYKNSYWELTLYRRIPLVSTNTYAVLVITMSNNYLNNRIENNNLFTIISMNNEPVFYCKNRELMGTRPELTIDHSVKYFKYIGEIKYRNESTMSATSTLIPYMSEDILYITTLDFKAIPYLKDVSKIYGLLIILIIFIPFVIIFIYTRYFSARVEILRGQMHKASNGDYDIIDSFHGDDEISETFSDLKIMIKKIKEKEADIYVSQLTEQKFINQQQEMEFKMLASQINPHFLYNTLEIIRMMAFTSGNKEVATAIKLLGKSMRYVLENTGTSSTTLKKELDYIDIYMAIQKLRFNDRIHYSLEVQEGLDLEKYQILPLLLQPIVENAIVHGLKDMENSGQIIITIKEEEKEFLLINISDNGIGMTEEEMQELNISIYKRNRATTRIGFYNINQRIKLCYGQAYGMNIQSRKNEGTFVLLKLPLRNILEE
jgi:two-component system, sensor histidine kinase YesM